MNLASPKSFKQAKYFAGAVNKLKQLEDAVLTQYVTQKNIVKEVAQRQAHRQFIWQIHRSNAINLARYFKIFGRTEVSNLIEAQTGLSTAKIFGIGIMLWQYFKENFTVPEMKFNIPEIQQVDVAKFEPLFIAEVEDLQPILRGEIQVNDKFLYAFHSMKRFPVLRNSRTRGTAYFSPLPDLIFHQITRGVYYLVKWIGPAGNILGKAFQQFIGDVLNATELTPRYTILPEERFGKQGKDTVDWIVANKDEALFVESKTKRFTGSSIEELLSDESTDRDLEIIAEAVVQIYKSISDYQNGKYPSLPYCEHLRIYPLVVTMEDWFLMGNSLLTVKAKAQEKMNQLALPLSWLETMPFSICSTHEFELFVDVIKTESVSSVIEMKQKDPEMISWTYAAYLENKYGDHIRRKTTLFPNIFEEILPVTLKRTREESQQ